MLSKVLTDALDLVEAAVRDAPEDGTASDDVIANVLVRRREPFQAEEVATSPALTSVHTPIADCASYDLLRGGRAAA
ncbi:hypothetical protein NFI95_04360 [Acetobacteraceae bacterium KSS8]|uniref:Uncharacterized protein n=1 Tax=Endosaccharibacter trunci TaxID=2812733 RepID=A0ABT1W480_9PROT|nr:hypothetical protein [Acetobacteraceae bacterium KSS8]